MSAPLRPAADPAPERQPCGWSSSRRRSPHWRTSGSRSGWSCPASPSPARCTAPDRGPESRPAARRRLRPDLVRPGGAARSPGRRTAADHPDPGSAAGRRPLLQLQTHDLTRVFAALSDGRRPRWCAAGSSPLLVGRVHVSEPVTASPRSARSPGVTAVRTPWPPGWRASTAGGGAPHSRWADPTRHYRVGHDRRRAEAA